ncbi:MAG: hypothetical protein LBT89_07550, partial [Planctomycetaceae bacterium]|nr:hypothetical protein [Planctomycetaceae bacterium]
MKLFWKHVLPRLLLIMLPIAAVQAQYTDKVQTDFSTITAVADTGAAEAGTALKILTITDGTNAYLHWSEAGATGLSNTPWTNGENIGNINATFEANQYGTGGSVGLIIADNFVTPINFAGQILDVGTIDVTSEASNTKPLVGLQLVGGPTAGSP